MSGTIDLSLLQPPPVIEALDFETILAARKTRLISLYPADQQDAIAAALELESEPMTKMLEEMAYAELTLRARINDAARAVLLATAGGAGLDQLSALYGVVRLVTDPGDAAAVPPVPPTYETDAALRARTQLAVEGFSTAGPAGAYRFHALSASGDVLDVSIQSPTPGRVLVTVLGADGDGVPPADLLTTVAAALNAEDVRPLTDEVIVQAATVTPYTIVASLVLYPGPASAPVIAEATAAAQRYADETHRLGYDVVLTGIYAALHRPGVQRVVLTEPVADIVSDSAQAAYCTAITLTLGGSDV